MNDYSISNNQIFDDAIELTTQYNEKLNEIQTDISHCKEIINDQNIFMGPIQTECMSEFRLIDGSMTSILDQLNNMSTYLTNMNQSYQEGDQKASEVIQSVNVNVNVNNTNANANTNQTYGIAKGKEDYNSSNSYTNTKNGVKYKLYDQGVGEWAGYRYTDGKNMQYRGCMLTAAASVSSAYDSTITPGQLFNDHRHDFVSLSVPDESNGTLSANQLSINNTTKQTIINNLQQGNPAIVMVKNNKFTGSQHYMALLDISADGKKVFVGNSHTKDGGNYSSNGWYSTDEVLTNLYEATIYTPSQNLVNKFYNTQET